LVSLLCCATALAAEECDQVTLEYVPGMSVYRNVETDRIEIRRCSYGLSRNDDRIDKYFRAVQGVLTSRNIPNDWIRFSPDAPHIRLTVLAGGRRVLLSLGTDDSGISPGFEPQGRDKVIVDGIKEIIDATVIQAQSRFRFAPRK